MRLDRQEQEMNGSGRRQRMGSALILVTAGVVACSGTSDPTPIGSSGTSGTGASPLSGRSGMAN